MAGRLTPKQKAMATRKATLQAVGAPKPGAARKMNPNVSKPNRGTVKPTAPTPAPTAKPKASIKNVTMQQVKDYGAYNKKNRAGMIKGLTGRGK